MISRLDLWNDTGYTESGVERPPIGASIRQPDFSYTDLKPDKGDLFAKVSLKAPYTDLMNVSYVRIYLDTANGDDRVIYGWVDSVALRSDTDGYPLTDISWHVDPWRTWCAQAEFRTGVVRRRAASEDIPPQPYPFRYVRPYASETLIPSLRDHGGNRIWWCYLTYVNEYDEGKTTGVDVICFPCSFSTHLYVTDGTDTGDSPSLTYALNGFFDECLGLTPSRVTGCFLSPIAPKPYTGDGSQGSPIDLHDDNAWTVRTHDRDSHTFGAFIGGASATLYKSYKEYSGSLSKQMRTGDTDRLVVTGFDGDVIATLPWGLSVRSYTYRMVVDAVGCYIAVRFDGLASRSEGLGVTIPCIPVDVTQNSWSEYNYSGMREYDIQMRQLAQREELVNGLANTLTSTASTAGLGMMFGGIKGTNLMRGAGATAGGGIASSLISYGLANFGGLRNGPLDEWGDFNAQEQRWEDYAHAKQTDSLVLPGMGWDAVLFGRDIMLVTMRTDDYSREQRDRDIALYGCHVTEPMASCQSLVEQGGPLQIANLTVGGDIPVEAKEYMRAMFSNGVRLV